MRSTEISGEKKEITEVKENKMTVKQIKEKLGLRIFTGSVALDQQVKGGYVSDLLSDVMGHAKEGEVWITLQSHLNVVAIASLKELSAIVLVKDIVPDALVLEKANEEGIPLLGTDEGAFAMAGKLYEILN